MTKFKKALTLLLAAILCVAMLAACGESEKKSTRKDDDAEATAEVTDNAVDEAEATPTAVATAEPTSSASTDKTVKTNAKSDELLGTWNYKEFGISLKNATEEIKQAFVTSLGATSYDDALNMLSQSLGDSFKGLALVLSENGVAEMTISGESEKGTWKLENGEITIEIDEEALMGYVYDDSVTIHIEEEESGITIAMDIVFVR